MIPFSDMTVYTQEMVLLMTSANKLCWKLICGCNLKKIINRAMNSYEILHCSPKQMSHCAYKILSHSVQVCGYFNISWGRGGGHFLGDTLYVTR